MRNQATALAGTTRPSYTEAGTQRGITRATIQTSTLAQGHDRPFLVLATAGVRRPGQGADMRPAPPVTVFAIVVYGTRRTCHAPSPRTRVRHCCIVRLLLARAVRSAISSQAQSVQRSCLRRLRELDTASPKRALRQYLISAAPNHNRQRAAA
jgi:hypothetical protein